MSSFRRVDERELLSLWRHRVVAGTFEAPDGERFERSYLRTTDAVAVVPVEQGQAVLVRQYRAPVDRLVLEIPAGLCDVDGEDGAATANRELAEEVGLQAAQLEHLATFLNMCGTADHATSIFLGTELTPCSTERHGPEERHMTIEHVGLDEVPRLIADGTIEDAKTVIGLLLARERLGR